LQILQAHQQSSLTSIEMNIDQLTHLLFVYICNRKTLLQEVKGEDYLVNKDYKYFGRLMLFILA